MSQHELDNDLPAYLVYLILANINRLRQVSPGHLLVRAVESALHQADEHEPWDGVTGPDEECMTCGGCGYPGTCPECNHIYPPVQLDLFPLPAFLRSQAD